MELRTAFVYMVLPFVLLVSLRYPFVGALIILGTNVLRDFLLYDRFRAFYWPLHGPQLLYIATFTGMIMSRPDKIKDLFPRTLVDWGMVGFLGVLVASAIFNSVETIVLNKYINLYFKALVMYFFLSRLTDTERRVLITVFVLLATTSWLVYIAWKKTREGSIDYARPYWQSSHHDFGLKVIMTLPLIGAMLMWKPKVHTRWTWPVRFGLFALIPLYVLAGVRTQSRSTYLGLGLALALIVWYHRRRWWLLVLASPFVYYAIIHNRPEIFQRIESIWTYELPSGRRDTSIQSRLRQIETAKRIWRAHPVLGIGPRQFLMRYLRWASPEEQAGTGRYTMHCVPLLILAEEGLAGFLVYYVCIFGGAMIAAYRVVRLARARDHPALRTLAIVAAGGLMGFISWLAYSLGQPAAWTINIYAIVAIVVSCRNVALDIVREEEGEEAGVAAPYPSFLPRGHTTEIVFTS